MPLDMRMWAGHLAGKPLLPVTTEQVSAITIFQDMGVVKMMADKHHFSSATVRPFPLAKLAHFEDCCVCETKRYVEIGFTLFT
jgi:hypothetical protein